MSWSAVLGHAPEQEAWARTLHKNLERCGCQLFLAVVDIAPGRSVPIEIQRALADAGRLLLVMSPECLASPPLLQQWSAAVAGGLLVVPLLLHETELPPFLHDRQYVDFRHHDVPGYRDGVRQLVELLGGNVGALPLLEIPPWPAPLIPEEVRTGWVRVLGPYLQALGRSRLTAWLDLPPDSLAAAPTPGCAATTALVLAVRDRGPMEGIAWAIRTVSTMLESGPRELRALLPPARSPAARSSPLQALRERVRDQCHALPRCFGGLPLAEVFVETFPDGGLPRAGVLLGPPGSGKSTLLRRMAQDEDPFTLYLRLPSLLEEPTFFIDHFDEDLRRAGHPPGLPEALERLGEAGRLRLFLDGLDEVPAARREEAERLILDLRARWPGSALLAAARTLDYRSLPDLTEVRLPPLAQAEQHLLLSRLAPATTTAALEWIARDPGIAEVTARPLGLATLALLLADGTAPEQLHERLIGLLLSGEHRVGQGLPLQPHVRRALAALARVTPDEGLSQEDLEVELVGSPPWRDLQAHRPWAEDPGRFLLDVSRRSGIIGPYDGPRWRFLYPTLRDALAAAAAGGPAIPPRRSSGDPVGEIEREPDPRARALRYSRLRWPTVDPAADLRRLVGLASRTRDGEELFLIDHALSRALAALPQLAALIADLRGVLLAHIPLPDPALFPPTFWLPVPGTEASLSITQINRRQYQSFDPGHPGRLRPAPQDPPDQPVVAVSWYAAAMFCRWLARAPGLRGARLPRELEWAAACRAGDPAGVEQRAFHKRNAGHRLQRTCQLSPSSAGFHDLPGNVREWCEDPLVDGGGEPDAVRVVRGACFLDEPEHLSTDRRLSAVPDLRSDLIGFRVVLERTDPVEANPWGPR